MDEHKRGRGLEGSWEWLEFAAGLPARHAALPGPPGWGKIVGGRSILTGASLVNTGTAAATVTIRDGEDATGDPVAVLVVPASGGLPWSAPVRGILAEIALYIASPGAGVTGVLYYVPLWHYYWDPPGQ